MDYWNDVFYQPDYCYCAAGRDGVPNVEIIMDATPEPISIKTRRQILETRFAAKKGELLEVRRHLNNLQKECSHKGAIHDCDECGAQDV